MSSAHVTLVKGDLRSILRARQISQATVRNMRENLVFALIYNALGVPIRSDEQRPRHARQGGPALDPPRATDLAGDGAQHAREPRLRADLQRARRAHQIG